MKAVRLVKVGSPLVMQDIPVPAPKERDVLVRVKAAGICHSDTHYRAGRSPVRPLPMTLGHEVAGVVESVGSAVTRLKPGDRVCLHYNITCGDCIPCSTGNEQFCPTGLMIGHFTDGGYAEYIVGAGPKRAHPSGGDSLRAGRHTHVRLSNGISRPEQVAPSRG